MSADFGDGYRAAIRDVLWLADGRDRYRDPSVKPQVDTAAHIAQILGGAPEEAWGWLPSWLWDEWAARRIPHVDAWADTVAAEQC